MDDLNKLQQEARAIADSMRIRAGIRRNIAHRRSVQEGKPDRIADLCDQGADIIDKLLIQLNKKDQ